MATAAVISDVSADNFGTVGNDAGYKLMDEYSAYEHGFLLHDRYQYVRTLQTGSFGKVSLAIDVRANRPVAIKAMAKGSGTTNMFRHEVHIMNRLGAHANIVELLEFFNTRDHHVLVLEYCDDGDLYDKIGTFDPSSTHLQLHVIKQIVAALKFMHSRRVFHRDLKPENVLVMKNGDVKICDFGLATLQTAPVDLDIGTEKYIAPEAISCAHYDARAADYWSLGITVCFLLFGKCPFKKAHWKDDNYVQFVKCTAWLKSYYDDTVPELTYTALQHLLALNPAARDLDAFEDGIIAAAHSGSGFVLDPYRLPVAPADGTKNNGNGNGNVMSVFEMDDLDLQFEDDIQDQDQDVFVDQMVSADQSQCNGPVPTAASGSPPLQIPASAHPVLASASSQPPSLVFSYDHMGSFSWADEVDDWSGLTKADLQTIRDDDTWFTKQ